MTVTTRKNICQTSPRAENNNELLRRNGRHDKATDSSLKAHEHFWRFEGLDGFDGFGVKPNFETAFTNISGSSNG